MPAGVVLLRPVHPGRLAEPQAAVQVQQHRAVEPRRRAPHSGPLGGQPWHGCCPAAAQEVQAC